MCSRFNFKTKIVISSLKNLVLSFNFLRWEESFSRTSRTAKDAPTIEGANVFENKYGLDFVLTVL